MHFFLYGLVSLGLCSNVICFCFFILLSVFFFFLRLLETFSFFCYCCCESLFCWPILFFCFSILMFFFSFYIASCFRFYDKLHSYPLFFLTTDFSFFISHLALSFFLSLSSCIPHLLFLFFFFSTRVHFLSFVAHHNLYPSFPLLHKLFSSYFLCFIFLIVPLNFIPFFVPLSFPLFYSSHLFFFPFLSIFFLIVFTHQRLFSSHLPCFFSVYCLLTATHYFIPLFSLFYTRLSLFFMSTFFMLHRLFSSYLPCFFFRFLRLICNAFSFIFLFLSFSYSVLTFSVLFYNSHFSLSFFSCFRASPFNCHASFSTSLSLPLSLFFSPPCFPARCNPTVSLPRPACVMHC